MSAVQAPRALGKQACTPESLRKLAQERSDVTVYEYTNDVPEAIMDPKDQVNTYRSVVAAFDEYCTSNPGAADEALRERVLNNVSKARLFQRLYSKVFACSTVRVSTPEEEARLDKTRKAIMFMLIERSVGEGGEDMKAARVMNTCMRMSMRDATAADLESGTKLDKPDGVEDATGQSELPQMEPLDRMELGPTSVKQGGPGL